MKHTLPLATLIIATIAGTAFARGFGGGLGIPVGDGIGGTGALWTDSIEGAGGLWGNGAYGAGLPGWDSIPGGNAAYGGFFSGPPQDNLEDKAPTNYHPLAGEQGRMSAPENYRAERIQSFNSSLAGMGIQTGGFRPGQFGPPPKVDSSAGMPSDLGLHQAGSQRSSGYARSARGASAATPAAANGARNWSTADLRVQGNLARSNFRDYGVFGRGWFAQYPNAWDPRGNAFNVWTPADWADVNAWFGGELPPYEYTYGNELTYENNDVCLDGRPIATADKYYASAAAIAQTGERANIPRESAAASWLPLGVFAAIPSGATSSRMLLQLAVNKAGIIRGNYFDPPAKNIQLVQGAVDKETERAAWVVADKKSIIFDCVLYNLTKTETPVLVHMGEGKAEQWVLVRLNKIPSGTDTR
jgi:hypothetical protein